MASKGHNKGDSAPVATADRPLYVDADGNNLGKSQPGAFIARRPAIDLETMFKGTLFDFPPHMSARDRRIQHLQNEPQELENRHLLERAIFNLSQVGAASDSVRLLRMAKEKGFSFVFDERTTAVQTR